MAKTTKQILDDDPAMGNFIDDTAEVMKWGANSKSTEEHPFVNIMVWPKPEYIEVTVSGPE